MPDFINQGPDTAQPQTENTETVAPQIPESYSSLSDPQVPNASSAQGEQQGDGREQFIPRTRFDEVNTQKAFAEQQLAFMQNQLANMYAAQPAQPQQPQPEPTAPQHRINTKDAEAMKAWQTRIVNEGPVALAEFVQTMYEDAFAEQNVVGQVQNLLDTRVVPHFVRIQNQVADDYISRRAAQEPQFTNLGPQFKQALASVLNERPDLDLNDHSLSLIAGFVQSSQGYPQQPQGYPQANPYAPQQGVPYNQYPYPQVAPTPNPYAPPNPYAQQNYPPQPQQMPFTERPGPPQSRPGQQAIQPLSSTEQQVARSFGMSDTEYRAYGSTVTGQ